MKKLLIVLLALTVIGVFAFADDAAAPAAPAPQGQFHAWNDGQAYLYGVNRAGNTVSGWGPDWENAIDQEWEFNYNGKNFGYDAVMEFGGDQGLSPISRFFTYYNFGTFAKVYFGKPRLNDFQQFDYVNGNNNARFIDTEWSTSLYLTPVEGLTAAVAYYFPNQFFDSTTAITPSFANDLGVALDYSIPKIADISVYYKQDKDQKVDQLFNVGAVISAIPNLGITVSNNYDITTSVEKAWVSVNTSAVAGLSVALTANVTNNSVGTGFGVIANPEYAITGTQYAVGLDIGYATAGGFGDSGNVPYILGNGGIQAFPYVAANFDGGYVRIGFAYSSGYATGTGDGSGTGKAEWGIPIAYVWSF